MPISRCEFDDSMCAPAYLRPLGGPPRLGQPRIDVWQPSKYKEGFARDGGAEVGVGLSWRRGRNSATGATPRGPPVFFEISWLLQPEGFLKVQGRVSTQAGPDARSAARIASTTKLHFANFSRLASSLQSRCGTKLVIGDIDAPGSHF